MTAGWRVGALGFGLECGTLRVSFQRYALPRSGVLRSLPRSLGALPVGIDSAGVFVLPMGDGEGVWIGLSAISCADWQVTARALLADGHTTLMCGPCAEVGQVLQLPGIPESGIWRPVSRVGAGDSTGSTALIFEAWSEAVGAGIDPAMAEVRLVTPDDAARLVPGLAVTPLDRRAGYKGYLLP